MSDREIFDIPDSMSDDELDDAEVQKFGNINELFDYLYDERIVENNGEYFYSTEFGSMDFDETDSEIIMTQ